MRLTIFLSGPLRTLELIVSCAALAITQIGQPIVDYEFEIGAGGVAVAGRLAPPAVFDLPQVDGMGCERNRPPAN
jgi:hypothetical protein